jgi:diphosphomevalonate decarboxylase
MKYTTKYLLNAKNIQALPQAIKPVYEIETHSPSNIALVKYWGKRTPQLPQNPSLSFTLSNSKTFMKIRYLRRNQPDTKISAKLFFEGKRNALFEKRIEKYLHGIEIFLPFIKFFDLEIHSKNTFPHSSGIASSASSMSALALNLCHLENQLYRSLEDHDAFLQKASFLSRLASGSASRSIYHSFVIWGECEAFEGSTDEFAIPLSMDIHPSFSRLQDRILIAASGKKTVSSSAGHRLMENHPYQYVRYQQARDNTKALLGILNKGDWKRFAEIVEEEAMSLHALMINSQHPYTLMNDNTWNIIYRIQDWRRETGLPLTYTLDAGPNVHLIFPKEIEKDIDQMIKSELKRFCQDNQVIVDFMAVD